jgi:outer membrane protein
MTNYFHATTCRSFYAIALTTLLFSDDIYAGEWSVGAGVLAEQLPYRDYNMQFMPLPIVTFEGEQFYINGQGAGIHIVNTDTQRLNFAINYSPLSYNPKDSDDPAMKMLEKRRATAMAGVSYQHHANWGTLSGEVATDILGYSDGMIVDIGYQYSLQFGKLQLVPGMGLQWQNRAFNDYYFGVSKAESQRSALPEYKAKSGVSSYLSLASYYSVNDNWQLLLIGHYEQMSDAVKNSPMVERDYNVMVATGVLYQF